MTRILSAVLLAFVLTAACEDESRMLVPDPGCAEITSVTITPGVRPSVSWAPSCLLGAVRFETADGEHLWSALATGNKIRGPVVYSELPADAYATGAGAPLVPGTTYALLLGVVEGQAPGPFTVIPRHQQSFVP